MKKQTKIYIISILIPLAVGGLSAFITRNNMDIFDSIQKPPISPPGFLFPIVWTVLYIFMGIGCGIICNMNTGKLKERNNALFIYGLQLFVNFFWSIIFFNIRAFLFSFIWLAVLWVLIVIMIFDFKKISKLAAYLQIPYILWVTFAGYLNFMIYLLN